MWPRARVVRGLAIDSERDGATRGTASVRPKPNVPRFSSWSSGCALSVTIRGAVGLSGGVTTTPSGRSLDPLSILTATAPISLLAATVCESKEPPDARRHGPRPVSVRGV